MLALPMSQPEGGAELCGRRGGPAAAVLVEVEAAGDGRALARAAERVGAVGEQGGRAGHAEPFGIRLGTWLLGQAADWLRLAQVSRLLDYAWLEGADPAGPRYDDYRAFPARRGLPRADPHRARMDQGMSLTAGGGGRRAGAG